MTTPDETAGLLRVAGATLDLGYEPAAAALPAQAADRSRANVRAAGRTNLLFDLAVLLALPVLLLLLNDSWSLGWVDTPTGSVWVDAGNQRAAPPPGWLVNYSAESLDTPIAWVDTFVYQSFFLDLKGNLNLHKDTWRGSYYPSRLPWLLLGNAVYSVAPPITANVMLRLLLFYVAAFSLYYIVRTVTRNDLAALVAALLLGANTYFLWAIGWNYVDGFAIATMLLMLALLTRAAVSEAWRTPLFFAGIAAATAVSVNLFLVVVAPSALVWYMWLNGRRQRHGRLASVGFVVAGGVAAVMGFSLIDLLLTGDPFYLLPQIVWAKSGATPSTRPLYPEAGWLVLPCIAAVLSVLFLAKAAYGRVLRRPLSEADALGVMSGFVFLQVLGVFAFLEFFSHSNVLEHPFYASYLLPFVYLVAGMVIHVVASKCELTRKARCLLAAGVVVALLAPLAVGELRFMPGCPDGCLASGRLQLLLAVALGLTVVVLYTRSARVGLALLLALSLVNVGVADRRVMAFSGSEREAMHNRSAMVSDTDALVRKHNPSHDMRYWVDLTDRNGWVYAAVAGQNLWNQGLVSLEFPKVRPGVELIPGDRIMLASATGDEIVARANEALLPQEVHLEVLEQSRIQRGNDGFDLFLATVMPGSLPAQDLRPGNTLGQVTGQ